MSSFSIVVASVGAELGASVRRGRATIAQRQGWNLLEGREIQFGEENDTNTNHLFPMIF